MIEKIFHLKQNKTTIKTEIIAGITTFLAVSYIMFVNPQILSQAGIDYQSAFIVTIVSSIIATLLTGLIANMPIALAPGMGINAFFTFTVCLTLGFSWQEALFSVFIAGLIFFIISITKIRQKIIQAIPNSLKNAIGVGIGFFITFIGLTNAGIIVDDPATLIALGDIKQPLILITILGIFIAMIFTLKNKSLALCYTMLITVVICLTTQFLFKIDLGIRPISNIVSIPPSMKPTFMAAFNVDVWKLFSNFNFWVVVFSFIFVDLFDTTGMLLSVSKKADFILPDGTIKNGNKVMACDAGSTIIGSVLGTSPVTAFVESLSGIAAGGRTGLTAVVTGICFVLSMFFFPVVSFLSPIMNAITTPALVLVGIMMISNIVDIDFTNFKNSASSFLTIIITLAAYSISEGIAVGIITYVICSIFNKEARSLPVLLYILCGFFIIHYLLL